MEEGGQHRRSGPDDVVVVHLLEERDLADGGGRDALVLLLESDLLERDRLVGDLVHRLVHHPVGALPDLLLLLVLQPASTHAREQPNTLNQRNQIKTLESESGQIARLPAPLRPRMRRRRRLRVRNEATGEEARGGWGRNGRGLGGEGQEVGKGGGGRSCSCHWGRLSAGGLLAWSSSSTPRPAAAGSARFYCCCPALVALAFMCCLTAAAFLAAAQPSLSFIHCGDDWGGLLVLVGLR